MTLAKSEDVKLPEKTEKEIATQETMTFVTFYMGEFLFGIPAEKIMEINKDVEITPVPLSDDYILGIMNLRGQIVTVMDLAKKVQLKTEITPKINLIIKSEDEAPVSFVVEQVGEILEIPIAKLEKPPEKIEGLSREYIKNVYQLPEKLVLILDIDKIIN
ncbi:MAG: chemotaxis protein CheW [Thermodesulfobacteria bacterium]|nr:chemotaxis protein CheW [Thermodesulfobacteriota bacterium]